MKIPANQWIIQSDVGVIVIGNGPNEMPKFERDRPFIRFNLSDDIPLSPMEIRVSNRRVAELSGKPAVFQVQSQWMKDTEHEQLQHLLTKQASKLGTELRCLPSTGLTTVHVCIGLSLSVQVFRMPLRPTMFRASELPPRQPLAAAFHNWLGEQRMAWRLIASQGDQLSWPDMVAKRCAIAGETEGGLDPYPRILNGCRKLQWKARTSLIRRTLWNWRTPQDSIGWGTRSTSVYISSNLFSIWTEPGRRQRIGGFIAILSPQPSIHCSGGSLRRSGFSTRSGWQAKDPIE